MRSLLLLQQKPTILLLYLLPVPYWAFVISMPLLYAEQWGIMSPVIVGVISAAGATLGQLPIFMVGYGGREMFHSIMEKHESQSYKKEFHLLAWAKRHMTWAVFVQSALPNPLHIPMTVAIGTTLYPPLKFAIMSFFGNLVKNSFLSFSGYLGLELIKKWLGF